MPVTTVGTSGPVVGMAVVDAFMQFAEVASNFRESDVTCVDCNFVVYAPPIMFVQDVMVASLFSGGAASFLDVFQKTCVTYLVISQQATTFPAQHLRLGSVSKQQ